MVPAAGVIETGLKGALMTKENFISLFSKPSLSTKLFAGTVSIYVPFFAIWLAADKVTTLSFTVAESIWLLVPSESVILDASLTSMLRSNVRCMFSKYSKTLPFSKSPVAVRMVDGMV